MLHTVDTFKIVEEHFTNAQKIKFLLDTLILNHLDGASLELEMAIVLIRDTNEANIKLAEDMGIYKYVKKLLELAYHLEMLTESMSE